MSTPTPDWHDQIKRIQAELTASPSAHASVRPGPSGASGLIGVHAGASATPGRTPDAGQLNALWHGFAPVLGGIGFFGALTWAVGSETGRRTTVYLAGATWTALKATSREFQSWWWSVRHHVPAGLTRRLTRKRWDGMVEARKLTGLKRGRVVATTLGVSVHLHLTGWLTLPYVVGKQDQLEAGLGLKHDSTRIVKGNRADRCVLEVRVRDLSSVAFNWPGVDSPDIRRPVPLAQTEHGDLVKVLVPQRTVIAGTSGAGKSVLLRIYGSAAVLCANADLTYVDAKAVEGSLWRGLADVATTGTEITAMAARLKAGMSARLADMAVRGEVDHVPTAASPARIIIVDEGAELKRLKLTQAREDFESIAQLGRAAGYWLVWATQYPTDGSGGLPVGIGTQADTTIGLRVETPRINRVVWGDDAMTQGWASHLLPAVAGWMMLRDSEHGRPERSRTFFLTKEHVQAMPRTTVRVAFAKPLEPVSGPLSVPPMPAYQPTVHTPSALSRVVRRRTLADDLADALETFGPLTQAQLNAALGKPKSSSSVSDALKRLVNSGRVAVDSGTYTVTSINAEEN